MSDREKPAAEDGQPSLASFVHEPTERVEDWRWLWSGNHEFPIESQRSGWLGHLVVVLKRLVRPLVRAPQADLWDRQRQFNLVLLAHLERLRDLGEGLNELGEDVQRVQSELLRDLRAVQSDLSDDLEKINTDLKELDVDLAVFKKDGLHDLARQTDALFSLLDQKIDRLRLQAGRIASTTVPSEPSDPA